MNLSVEDLKNINPVGKTVSLKYEVDYSGEEKTSEVRVYPLTVREKIIIQELNDKIKPYLKIKEPTDEQAKEINKLNEELNLKYVYFALKKVMPNITEEIIKTTFPNTWYKEIFEATLETEGLNLKEIKEEKN